LDISDFLFPVSISMDIVFIRNGVNRDPRKNG
jgi:hypothetical protein